MAQYANIIVDISQEKLDKTFQYRIPAALEARILVGMQVYIPFGNRKIKGYVVELTDEAEYDTGKLKDVTGIVEESIPIESQLIALAGWMRKNYGGTMNHALKTVIPIKAKKNQLQHKRVRLAVHPVEAKNQLAEYQKKHNTARARLLEALLLEGELEWDVITHRLNVAGSVIHAMEENGILKIISETQYRNPVEHLEKSGYDLHLNGEQQQVVDEILSDYDAGVHKTYLLKGVTGSGKTEVYMELIAHVIEQGKQAIVLIPEIALTYQTVMRFYNRFGNRVSIMNSRLSQGERYDQFERAKKGEIDIMIGPRSALFTPFLNLGIIIIDEEHETSYKSETLPRYHARETAIERAKMTGASVVLGSATPSLESFYRAKRGEYRLLELKQRVLERPLPVCEVIDLREELKMGNRSILSRRLTELMADRLAKGQQIMLFLNRRGMAGFVSCRACGHVLKCPHCDVSLSQHNHGRMVCHYCGYEEPETKTCPSCGSNYIGGFKAGTEKIELVVKKQFPKARVLRMDADTTRSKEGYEKILSAFANQEADILIGTQMIVKGHDFASVTLVGVLAADLSLHVADYHAPERTFQLLTQAAGRAGRGAETGEVVIQTYDPSHYSIVTSCKQNYEAFYEQEIEYRKMLLYPPVWNMLVILCASPDETQAASGARKLAAQIDGCIAGSTAGSTAGSIANSIAGSIANSIANSTANSIADRAKEKVYLIGPADAAVAKVNDIYKKVVYIKAREYRTLVELKDMLEQFTRGNRDYRDVMIQFDFNPINSF